MAGDPLRQLDPAALHFLSLSLSFSRSFCLLLRPFFSFRVSRRERSSGVGSDNFPDQTLARYPASLRGLSFLSFSLVLSLFPLPPPRGDVLRKNEGAIAIVTRRRIPRRRQEKKGRARIGRALCQQTLNNFNEPAKNQTVRFDRGDFVTLIGTRIFACLYLPLSSPVASSFLPSRVPFCLLPGASAGIDCPRSPRWGEGPALGCLARLVAIFYLSSPNRDKRVRVTVATALDVPEERFRLARARAR